MKINTLIIIVMRMLFFLILSIATVGYCEQASYTYMDSNGQVSNVNVMDSQVTVIRPNGEMSIYQVTNGNIFEIAPVEPWEPAQTYQSSY